MENKNKFKRKVLRYLKYRVRTEGEVRNKFKKIIPPFYLEEFIKEFKQLGLIDDRLFCKVFTEEKLRKGYGRKAIYFELMKKGVDKNLIEEVVCNISKERELKVAWDIVKKKIKDFQDKRKIYQLLLRRGFDRQIILSITEDENL